VFKQFDASEKVDIEVVDKGHGWHLPLRERTAEWMVRWLRGEKRDISEPEGLVDQVLSKDEIRVTETGQVLHIDDARSAHQINNEVMRELRSKRKQLWRSLDEAALRDRIREVTGIRALDELGKPTVEPEPTLKADRFSLTRYRLKPEPGIVLPVVIIRPNETNQQSNPVLWMHTEGLASGDSVSRIKQYLDQRRTVVAMDPRGIGQTATDSQRWYGWNFTSEGQAAAIGYLLDRPFATMRAEDVLWTAHFAQKQLEGDAKLDLAAQGEHVALPALHAAALEPELFGKLKLKGVRRSYEPIVTQPMGEPMNSQPMDHVINGALRVYDLPRLRELAGMQ